MFASNIVIDITYFWFEAGQKLVRSRSNYLCRTKYAKFAEFVLFFAHGGQPWLIRLFSGLKLLQIVFQSDQDDCWMLMHDSVQRDAVCVRDLNIASSEYRTDDIDLVRANRSAVWTTLLLLNFFAGRGSSVRCASVWYAAGRGFHPHVRHILLEGEWSWKKFLRPLSPFRWFKKGQLSVTGKRMCTNDTG